MTEAKQDCVLAGNVETGIGASLRAALFESFYTPNGYCKSGFFGKPLCQPLCKRFYSAGAGSYSFVRTLDVGHIVVSRLSNGKPYSKAKSVGETRAGSEPA
jgi:hypothetical protein